MPAIRAAFFSKLALVLKMIQDAHATDSVGNYVLPLEERELITNASFLRMFIAFEEFCEAAFIHYAVGRMSTTRWKARRYIRPLNADHANRILVGTQRFVDWSTPDTTRKLAKLYFELGDPFEGSLSAATSHLLDMKTVRNATAHLSRTTQAAIDGLQSRWTGVPVTGTSAYAMILSHQATTGVSFLKASENVLRTTVAAVADR